MDTLRDAGWILVGVLLGAGISTGMVRPPADLDAVSLASLTVLTMLAATLPVSSGGPPVPR